MKGNRPATWWVWLWAAALLAGLGGCEDTSAVAPAEPVVVTVNPAGSIQMQVGDTLRLRVTVQNAPPAVSFQSTLSTVASVSGTGLVTALSPGATSIIVSSQADPSRSVSVAVLVSARPGGSPGGPASVFIQEVLDPVTGQPAGRESVRGRVLVRVDYTPGSATRLEVLAGDSIFCMQDLNPSSALAPAAASRSAAWIPRDCVLNTAQFDSVSGAVAFPNGPLALTARLVGRADSVLARAVPVGLGLANRDTLLARASAPRSALDAQGLRWEDGDLTVAAIPVIYGGGAPIASVRFAYAPPGGDSIRLMDAEAPFSITLPESAAPAAGGLLGVVDANLRVSLTSVRGGEPGPRSVSPTIRYDNESPQPGGLLGRRWVGARTRFADLYDARAQRDAGVGRVSARLYVGDPALTAEQIIAGGREVTTGADLREASVGSYRLAARVCDALENCVPVLGFAFGVDLTPPSAPTTVPADRAVNPGAALVVTGQDNLSGLGELRVQASVTMLDADPATPECGPAVEEIDLPGLLQDGVCVPQRVDVLPIPSRTPGYYVYRIALVDQADNVGEAVTRTVVVDHTAPTIESLALPAQFVTGQAITVRAEVSDNLDLGGVAVYLVYPSPGGGLLALPFAAPDSAGVPFDEQLVRRYSASVTLPLVRTMTYRDASVATGFRTVLADSLRVRARDVARNLASVSRALPQEALPANPFSPLDSVSLSQSQQLVCTARCTAGDPDSLTLTARVSGPSGLGQPFEAVYFFRRASDGTAVLIGTVRQFNAVGSGSRTAYSYRLIYTPPAGLAGDFTLLAVGVSRAGHALRLGEGWVQFFTR